MYLEEAELLFHPRSVRCAVLLILLLCSPISWATDIQCESTQQPGQRVICDHAILSHEYDDIYEQQQQLVQQGKLGASDLAAWKRKRDGCADVHCIDGVFAEWSTLDKNRKSTPAAPVITASEALGPAPGALPASSASPATAEASQQSSGVPVARQGSAMGVALPQPVASDASASAPISAASATTGTPGGSPSSALLVALGVLLLIVIMSVGAMMVYQKNRKR